MEKKYINKSGFKTKTEAEKARMIAYNEYMNTGHDFTPKNMSYSDFLDIVVDEEYYLTNNEYEKVDNNKISFVNKDNNNIEYEVDMDKYKTGGVCGKDNHTKFHQSSRLFSQNGYCPTLTANNTPDNAKVVLEV